MPGMIDKQLVRERFERSLRSYAKHAVVQNRMASDLSEMVFRQCGRGPFGRVFEVGSGTGALTLELLKRCRAESYFANDIVEESRIFLEDVFERFPVGEFGFVAGDIESGGAIPECLDLVVSNATMQWLGDLEGFFRRIRSHVRPGGVLAFSTFGPMNMQEIASIEQTGLPYLSIGEITELAGKYFDIAECREEQVKLEFTTPEAVLRHIRLTGVNGVSRKTWTKGRYRQFLDCYLERFPSGEGVSLTYHPIYCCLKKENS
ncbi:MAG: malonyl-ACP O-methyltransferase BioC [Chlorobiaceae bacterium]|nr:malonyl-ACP O-methyltransferase BioC [Chlorobiaceae bacterium]NTW09771.1 malonyl-ACP O-methyltransferase BioC [Chlorobiaceae bacterium]